MSWLMFHRVLMVIECLVKIGVIHLCGHGRECAFGGQNYFSSNYATNDIGNIGIRHPCVEHMNAECMGLSRQEG